MSGQDQPERHEPTEGDGEHAIAQDARALRRGVSVNFIGYGIKLAHPLLLAVATHLYGAGRWGVFVVGQAATMVLVRVCLMGLDKGVLWWLPRQALGRERSGLLGALARVVVVASALAAVLVLLPSAVFSLFQADVAVVGPLRIMATGMVPLVVMELLLHATMAKRRMEPQVLVRETAVPVAQVGSAVLLYLAGLREVGLAVSFVVANAIGAAGAMWSFARIYRGSAWPDGRDRLALPRPLRKFSGPIWLAEITNSLLQRLDLLLLAGFVSASAVGVYGVVTQLANALRSIRRSFDPLVTATVSQISVGRDRDRLTHSYSDVTALVTATQLPVFAFVALFADVLLRLFGQGFDAGTWALVIFAAFWTINGAAGLAGLVVAGFGYSRLTLLNTAVCIVLQAALVFVLAPRFGIEGTAVAVGAAYSFQHVLQLVQMRVITGGWNLQPRAMAPSLVGVASLGLLALTWWALSPLVGNLPARAVAFGTFLVVYGASLWVLRARGLVSRPEPSPARAEADTEAEPGAAGS